MESDIKLNSGHYMPRVGLGTWLSQPGEVGNAVKIALSNGYRHIDCAQIYQNQTEVGEALAEMFKEGIAKRDDVHITSKIWNTSHSFERAKKAIDTILKELKLDYLDLCLIHWPHGYEEGDELFPKTKYSNVDYLDTWRAMEEYVMKGKIHSIGISNFNHKQIQRLIDNAVIKPSVLQVELHPYFQQRKLRDFCQKFGIAITAYSPLANPAMPFRKEGSPVLLEDAAVLKLAEVYHKTPAQIILRWAVQHGLIVIPKSVTEKRIIENIDIFDFDLKLDDMAVIDGLDRNWRLLDLSRDGDHPLFPFSEEY